MEREKKKIAGWKMARFVPGKWRGGVVHCYPLSFAVKANITVIRGNCGRTNREPAKEGRHRRHLFAASQTVNFPGTSDCLASNTQSEIARQRSTTRPAWLLPSFLPSVRPMRSASFSPTTFRSVRRGGGWKRRRQSRLLSSARR